MGAWLPEQAPQVTPAPAVPASPVFDLATLPKRAPACGTAATASDVVVCAPKAMDFTGIDPATFADTQPRLGTDLPGGGVVQPRVVQRGLEGDSRPAAMIEMKLAF